jgi:hypothetical protein
LIFAQPVKIAHKTNPPQFRGLNHAGLIASSRLMGPEPKRLIRY